MLGRKCALNSDINLKILIKSLSFSLHSKYAVYVMDNRNLQHLFHWDTHPNITIGNGKLFFHFNPKLCMSEIHKLNEYIGRNATFGHGDINPSTNGDQVACKCTISVKNKFDSMLLERGEKNPKIGLNE